jgi:hypothetical protein
MQPALSAPEPMTGGSGNTTEDDQAQYLPVDRLKRMYYDYLGAKDQEVEEAREARHYYHGDQWTAEEIAVLQRRKQPVVTSNRIERKINAVVGIVEKLRQDPKAYARTPDHEQGADVATAVMRYCLDTNDWKSKSTRNARLGAVDGIAGVEFDLETGDHGDPDLGVHIVYADTFFYDPRSFDEGFTDARYMGIAKWIDVDQAKELLPNKSAEIDDLMETGSDITSSADQDRERVWVNTSLKRLRLVDHWYIHKGKWCWTLYIGNTVMMQGLSPFHDEKGKTFPRFLMFSANVDQDGDRYGFIRNLKSAQDEINMRRSKALHLLNSRRVVSEKGAVDDVETARREWAKPDGWIETNPGLKMETDDAASKADFSGQLEMLQEAKTEIENFGPNPALIGQGLEDSSGRAIALLQQAGMAELGPYLSAYKNWKIRVYRCIWNIITEHWKAERWIRVTDDQNVAQFFQINKRQTDQYGFPSIINAIGTMDVDFIIDEGPDTVNMQGDAAATLQALGPQFAQNFPEIALELSPLEVRVKTQMLKKIQAKQSQPPPVDPKIAAQGQLKQMELQADGQKAQADNSLEWRKAQLQALTQIEVARITAKTDQDSGTLAAKLEGILGFAQLAHEQNQSAQDRAHEAVQNDADRRSQQVMAARQQAADAQQAAAQPAPQAT